MRKHLKYLVTVLVLISSQKLFGRGASADTFFLLKDATHTVFIDTDRHSRFYNVIGDFSFGQFDTATYDRSLDYLKERKMKLTKNNIHDIPKKWILLNYYKNKFYTYYPSDFYSHFKLIITDTAFIDFSGEGPCANKVLSYKRVDGKTMEFSLAGIEKPSRRLIIHIIDEQKGIAVFEEPDNKDNRYYLMISAEKMRQLPIIVNHCTIQKEAEVEFDEPNFKKLIGLR
jgi:hypothetical protein